jgi:uncharacterized protein
MLMNIWAIADLHLSFGVPEKTMEVFGPLWANYAEKIGRHWQEVVKPEDLVLIAGDISWALKSEHARKDLEWIDQLAGVKVLIKGNHDYWWQSLTKAKQILPPSLHLIQNNAFHYKNVSIAGTRLWDSDEYSFDDLRKLEAEQQKIFNRELERLELSLKELSQDAEVRIAMTHYPPIGRDLKPSKTTALLEKYHVQICVFGHLHNITQEQLTFGKSGNIVYYLTSCDYLNFKPLKIYSSAK